MRTQSNIHIHNQINNVNRLLLACAMPILRLASMYVRNYVRTYYVRTYVIRMYVRTYSHLDLLCSGGVV